MGIMTNPKMMQAMLQMGDPELMMAWMQAAANPQFLNAIMAEAALAHLYGEPKTSKQTQEATIRLFIEGLKR